MTTPVFAEPTVEDMLADPIVRLVMQRDGVEEAELRLTLRRLAAARTCIRNGRDGRARSAPAPDADAVAAAEG
ncbi:MAG: hypothetical protein WD100_11755 [Tistlia sp.]|uniref:hypothetical protein n=1 Tax=Tistlia sp. TaxID=3057121 RepID=UPI0034A13BC8